MQALVKFRELSVWIYMFPLDEHSSKYKKWAQISLTFLLILETFIAVISTGTYCQTIFSLDLEKFIYGLVEFVALTITGCIFIYSLTIRHKLIHICNQLTDIYETCMH